MSNQCTALNSKGKRCSNPSKYNSVSGNSLFCGCHQSFTKEQLNNKYVSQNEVKEILEDINNKLTILNSIQRRNHGIGSTLMLRLR